MKQLTPEQEAQEVIAAIDPVDLHADIQLIATRSDQAEIFEQWRGELIALGMEEDVADALMLQFAVLVSRHSETRQ